MFETIEMSLREMAGQTGSEGPLSPKREATRQRLLDAARSLMTEQGIQRTSMEDIARAAGVSRGTLYTYAKSKDDVLLMSLAEESLNQLQSFATFLAPNVEPKDRLEGLLVQKILFYETSPFASMLAEGDVAMLVALRNNPHYLRIFGSEEFKKMGDLSTWIQAAVDGQISEEDLRQLEVALTAFLASGPALIRKLKELGGELEPSVRALARVIVEGIATPSTTTRGPSGR